MTGPRAPELHSLAFAGCADAMLLLDVEGCVLELNPAAERLLARRATEALGRGIDETLEPASPLAPLIEEARQGRTARALSPGATLGLGSERTIAVDGSLSPLFDAEGAYKGAL